MTDFQTLPIDAFRAHLLERFRQPVRVVSEVELQKLLSNEKFPAIQNFAEYCEQLRLIADSLARATPAVDAEVLAMMRIVLERVQNWYQRSLLELPRVALATPSAASLSGPPG